MRFDDAFALWEDGVRRLAAAEPGDRPAMERVVDELVLELRRQLGGPFNTDELARLYSREGTDWAFAIATRLAPGNPAAWDMPTVVGSAFARYARDATDFRIKQAALEEH
jgi:hypothetical protein